MNKLIRFLKGGGNYLPGIDIGSYSSKLTYLESYRRQFKLIAHAEIKYEDQVITGTEIVDRYMLSNYIKELMKLSGVKEKEVAIHIPLSSCFYTVISVPEEKEPELAVSEYMQSIISPEEIPEVKIDYRILPLSIEEGTVDIAIAAVKKSFVNDRISLLEQAGLKAVVVDIEPAALNNQFYMNNPEHTATPVCLVDIGASFTKIIVSFGGYPYITRNIETGGNFITEQLQKEFLISVEEAEMLKKGENLKEISYEAAFNKVIIKFIKKLITEIMWTIENFKDRFNLEVEDIFLYGGSSKLKGIVDEIKNYTGKNVYRGEPLKFAGISESQEFGIATGLSLRYKGDQHAKV
jgi:type IV pilus assembly protein PilM